MEYSTGIDASALNEIGQGGEGRVFEFIDHPETIYKEFHFSRQHPPNLHALKQLVALPESCSEPERAYIESRTVWPRTVVTDHGRARGYLMRRIPDRFFRQHGLKKRPMNILCAWDYLSMRNSYISNPRLCSEIPQPSAVQITDLIVDLANTVSLLHRHGVVIGDISGRNLAWTDQPTWHVLLIDCDSFRVRGSGSVNYPKQTPDWEDPAVQNSRTNQQSDIYKLGIAAYRAVWAATVQQPPNDLASRPPPQGVPAALPSLVARSTGARGRPSAAEWVQGLTGPSTPEPAPTAPSRNKPATRKQLATEEPKRPTIQMRSTTPNN